MSTSKQLENKIILLIKNFNEKKFDFVIEESQKLYKDNKKLSIIPNLIGASYAGKKNHSDAIIYFKKALIVDQKNIEILNNIGKSQIELRLYNEALITFNKSLELDNQNFDTLFNLGIVYFSKDLYVDALKYYHKAIKINSKIDKLNYNIAISFSRLKKIKEATKYFIITIDINKNHYKAYNNLALILYDQNKYDDALNYLNQSIKINPRYSLAFNNLGNVYLAKKNYKLAIKNFTIAYDLDSDLAVSGIQKHFIKRTFCNWSEYNELKDILKKSLEPGQNVSPWFALSLEDNPKNHFLRAKNFSNKFILLRENKNKYSNKKIRIGYYAADFHQHAGMINMEGIFKNHNKEKFEIIGFYYGELKKDKTHYRIKKCFDKFFYVNELEDEEIYNLSIKNKIDIAIYRAGLTVNSRSSIFSQKVAPIQINFLAYPGTTGQDGVDYIISDKFVIPEKYEKYYSENIIFLTDCYYPRDNNRNISSKKFNKEELGIDKETFVFCSFNNSYKISHHEFDVWLRILNKVKKSVLILLESQKEMCENLARYAIKNNIKSNRIIFLQKIDFEDHLARHSICDLFLDSFNYNSHTTAVDALWTSLPILTKVGESFPSRICGSLLNHMGLNELVVNSKEEYFNKAVELAENPKKYNQIKEIIAKVKLSGNFFNTKKYTQNLERAFQTIHKMRTINNKFENIHIKNNY